jgi:protein-ribulosamine 3-kinase
MEHAGAIARELSRLSGLHCAPQAERRVAGGSINACYAWPCAAGRLFVKIAPAAALRIFEAESAGLAALALSGALRVPRVLACGTAADSAFLALEWLESAPADPGAEARLGSGLAALHCVTATRFGLARDNFIGSTPQLNGWLSDWALFFRERRLRPQLELATGHGYGALLGAAGARLLEAVPALLAGHEPAASLLHGDLWGGNWLCTSAGEATIFDPAVYYGDRETDIAMTRLFGGFGPGFYRAYQAAAPLAQGWQQRGELYNLYHVLNHLNLFGGGYAAPARAIMDRLLS